MTHGPQTSAMLTDLYQITMAQGYYASGKATAEAAFHLSFRENPFDGGYAIAAGLAQAIDFVASLHFTAEDLRWLAGVEGNDGLPVFTEDFLAWLGELRFTGDIDAVPEGTVVFPHEPLLTVTGPIAQCQLIETALLNAINFQTLVATKAARVCYAAEGRTVVEFGLRRAQGPDGGISASRASYIGGCSGTSNVLAAQTFGIPASGTHAHSWVMAFDSETAAFEAYARELPNNCTFLVDTYDTLDGVRRAVEAGRHLRERGHEMIGIRLDSGDLAWLSNRAREILDAGGFPDAKIVASSELDEHLVASLLDQDARIDVFGVGTRLAAAWDQPALGGVYKLSAIREPGGEWRPRIKVSSSTAKVTTPGLLGVRRYVRDGTFAGDVIFDTRRPPEGDVTIVDPADPLRSKTFSAEEEHTDLLLPVFRRGERVYDSPAVSDIRERALGQLAMLDDSHKRFLNPHVYPVGLEQGVHDLRAKMILEARGKA